MTKLSDTDVYWSRLYDQGRDYTLLSSGVLTRLLSFADNAIPKTCIDIGCGTGRLTRELYHRGYQCVGVDASTSAIRLASQLTVVAREQLRYVRFDIEHDDTRKLPQQPYSLITCKLVYAFIQDKPAFVQKVKQLLAPGGIFVVITPHTDETPKERSEIAVGDRELKLLAENFQQLDMYKGDERGGALTYFVGSNLT